MLAYHKRQSQDSTPMWLMPRASMEHSVPRVFCPVGNTSTSPPSFALSMWDLRPHSVIQKGVVWACPVSEFISEWGGGGGGRRDRERKEERKQEKRTLYLRGWDHGAFVCASPEGRVQSRPQTTTERQPRIRSETRKERVPTCHRIRKKTGWNVPCDAIDVASAERPLFQDRQAPHARHMSYPRPRQKKSLLTKVPHDDTPAWGYSSSLSSPDGVILRSRTHLGIRR